MPFLTQLFKPNNILSFTSTGREKSSVPKDLNNLAQVEMQQVHGNNICEVVNTDNHCVLNCDAIYTSQKSLLLKVKTADCLPILIAGDNFAAAAHAGRRGTELKIAKKLCNELKKKFSPKIVSIYFGPHICKKCYQINRETDEHYDLLSENRQQIFSVFPEAQLVNETWQYCTAHENQKFFSYRKEGKGVFMNWSGIVLTK